MVRVLTPCTRCRATVCRCGYAAEKKAERIRRERLRRPYDHEERKLHASIIASWVERYGWTCPGLAAEGHRPHPVPPGHLDVDDIVPYSRGGDRRNPANKRVLCRRWNRSRGAQEAPQRPPRAREG